MKVLGNIVILAAGIPLLLGMLLALSVLFVGAFGIALSRKTAQALRKLETQWPAD